MSKLQIGVESFREIREQNYYYVDKTGLIEEFFANSFCKVSLITRPGAAASIPALSEVLEVLD